MNEETSEPEDGLFVVESFRPFYKNLSTGLGLLIIIGILAGAVIVTPRLLPLLVFMAFLVSPCAIVGPIFLYKAFFGPKSETIIFRDNSIDLWKVTTLNKDQDHTLEQDSIGHAIFHSTPLFGSYQGGYSLEYALVSNRFLYLVHFLVTYILLLPFTVPLIVAVNFAAKTFTQGMGFMTCAVAYEYHGARNFFPTLVPTNKYRYYYIAPVRPEDAERMIAWLDARGIPCKFNRYPWSALLGRGSSPR